MVLASGEIVAIVGLAVAALHICVSRGRASSEEMVTIERRPDGTETTTIRRKVTYGISAKVADIVRAVLRQ